MRTTVLRLVAVGLAVSSVSLVDAQEWTRFRGPNGTGISDSKTIPVEWTEKDYNWSVEIAGVGHSQPVIWGERIFLTTAEKEGAKRTVLCLSTKDGDQIWSKSYDMTTHRKHNLNSYASSSPAVDSERVFVLFVTPDRYLVVAFDHGGKELWKKEMGDFKARHGYGASPMLFEGKVIVTSFHQGDSFVAALDAKTGKEVWKTPHRSDSAAYGTPTLLERPGKKPQLLLTSKAHGISCLDARSGEMLWEAPVFPKLRSVSSAVVYKDLVFGTCGSGGGGNYLVAVRMDGKGDVAKSHFAYRLDGSSWIPYVPTSVVVGDHLFLCSDKGFASCIEAGTGKVIWGQKRLGGNYYSSPVAVNGHIYCTSSRGEVVILKASDKFEVVARNKLGDDSHVTPVVAGGKMYLRTFSRLISLGGRAEP